MKHFATFVSRAVLYQLELVLKTNHSLFYRVKSLLSIGKMLFFVEQELLMLLEQQLQENASIMSDEFE